MGPMAGRGAGYCADNAESNTASLPRERCFAARCRGGGFGRGLGLGLGFGFRGGRGRGVAPFARPSAGFANTEQEQSVLQTQAETLERALADVRTRLADLAPKQ